MPRATCVLLLMLMSLAVLSEAATVIAAGTKTVAACGAAVKPAAQILDHLPYPADWKVVVVCNENTWDLLMRQKGVNFISDYGFTFRPNHVTFIRAKVFLERMQYTPEQVLKHELGHIACSCDDEKVAWSWTAYPSEALGKLGTSDVRRATGITAAHSGSSNSKVAGY